MVAQTERKGRAMTFTAREIVAALHNEGWLDAAFVNTGGWVMNVSFTPICQHDVALGEVCASDNGDWGYGDIDTPAESVGVMAYGPDGDPLDDEPTPCADTGSVLLAFDALSYRLERYCPACYADHGSEG